MLLFYLFLAVLLQSSFAQECFRFNYTGDAQQFVLTENNALLLPADVTINSTVNSLAVNNITGYASDYDNLVLSLYYQTTQVGLVVFVCDDAPGSDFNLGFNDSATSYFYDDCNPFGVYKPQTRDPLSTFDNFPTLGSWNLSGKNFGQLFGNITGYGITICPNYFDLVLTSVNVNGTQVNFTVNSDANSYVITSIVTLDCGNGRVTSGSYDTSTITQQLSIPSGFNGTCSLTASAPYNSPFFTNATTSVYIPDPTVSIVSPATGAILVVGQDVAVAYTVSDGSAPSVSVSIMCGNTTISSGQSTSSPITLTTDNVDALGSCEISFGAGQYVAGSPVNVFFYRQLILTQPTERSFVGGQSVDLEITSSFSSNQQINFIVTCPSKTLSYLTAIDTPGTIDLPIDLSGIGCTFTTTGLPEFYLPIPSTSVYIALSQQQVQAITQQLSFATFQVSAPAGGAGGTGGAGGNDQAQKNRFGVKRQKSQKLQAFYTPVESKLKSKVLDKRTARALKKSRKQH